MTPKVTIEITPDGWIRTVNLGNKTYIERWVRIPTGAKSIAGNFEDEKGIDDDLYGGIEHNERTRHITGLTVVRRKKRKERADENVKPAGRRQASYKMGKLV